ncbi:MAG: DUF3857 domain-containing protein [Flammeovirgaceae bacterium]|nr:MAG: DUF3857 domain-containing protein [Flammeovirgaceae bacterium]
MNEFGDAFFDPQDNQLIFDYHCKIKILKPEGVRFGDFEVSLYKSIISPGKETLMSVKGSVFNLENNQIIESKLEQRDVISESVNKNYDVKKFALPNVRVGSVIEVIYQTSSPFIYNFHGWKFQAEIPKIKSEYHVKIPGKYIYNIQLKGFLNLSKNESTIVKDCMGNRNSPGSPSVDCVENKYGMENIPAFDEEDYMTAKKNFISAITFELSEIRHLDGHVEKITKEWKDAEKELSLEQRFGRQLKRGKEIGKQIDLAIGNENDPLEKAKKIYTYIKDHFMWNEVFGFLSDLGVKKAFDTKTGSVADINLTLIAALDYAGFQVEPMLLSTRANGLATELHPVLSDFNYVVAKLNLDNTIYLLDATDPYLPFGMLPERCWNGKGRVFGEKNSYWLDLKPLEKDKKVSVYTLELDPNGVVKGTVQYNYYGYASVNQRKKILAFGDTKNYVSDLQKKSGLSNILNYTISGLEDIYAPIVEKFTVEIEGIDNLNKSTLFINPFFASKIVTQNPFRSAQRLYPVDFGVPMERTSVLNLSIPEGFELVERPDPVTLSLPSGGGRFVYQALALGNNKFAINYSLVLNKTVYNSQEYQFLKNFFGRIIQIQQADLIFRKAK